MTEPTFRTARVFDGTGADGRPQVDRQMLEETEAVRVLAYLESAPVVLAAQGFGPDRVGSSRGQQVPLTWHTDGAWVWPGAVTYYLRTYALPPDPEFLTHIRQRQYQAPTVDPASKQAAMVAVSSSTSGRAADEEDHAVSPSPSLSTAEPGAAPTTAANDDSSAFDRLRSAAVDLAVPPGAYRIGAAADGAWCLFRDGSRWTVFLADRGARKQAAAFDTSQQAIAYLVGQLYLAGKPSGAGAAAVPDLAADRVATAVDAPAADVEAPAFDDTPARSTSPERPGETAGSSGAVPLPAGGLAAVGAVGMPTARAGRSPFAGDDLVTAEPAGAAEPDSDVERAVADEEAVAADQPAPDQQPAFGRLPVPGQRPAVGQQPPVDQRLAAAQQPTLSQPAESQPGTGQPSAGQPGTDLPTAGQPGTDLPTAGQPRAGQQPTASQPAAGGPAAGHATAGQPTADRPAGGQQPGAGQQAAVDQPPTTGQQATESPDAAGQLGAAGPSLSHAAAAAALSTPPGVTAPTAAQADYQAAARPGPAAASPPHWKIQPLPGDPPLTLYRDKRLVMLPAGTEVDRYGEPGGNVTYAARTQYQHRSLPDDWINYPYHVYRLQRPLEALTGFAVPWFEQPGGGTAFVLPGPINELVADGSLVEIGVQAPQPQPAQSS